MPIYCNGRFCKNTVDFHKKVQLIFTTINFMTNWLLEVISIIWRMVMDIIQPEQFVELGQTLLPSVNEFHEFHELVVLPYVERLPCIGWHLPTTDIKLFIESEWCHIIWVMSHNIIVHHKSLIVFFIREIDITVALFYLTYL